MQAPVTLRSSELLCEIKPELGGCISGLWWKGIPVLRSTVAQGLHSVRQSASYPLVPYSNRVGNALLQWQGREYPLVRNWQPDPHSIHGVGWERPWLVQEATGTHTQLVYEHRSDDAWPFDFEASQTIRIDANALEMGVSITNRCASVVPVGLGWHPYFVKRVDARVRFDATGRWEMGDDKLPTHRAISTGVDGACASLEVDHCFDGWNGMVQLHDAELHVRMVSSLNHLVVYTTPERDTIAIEPVSHVNNAVNRMAHGTEGMQELGVRALQPGDTFSATVRIEVEGA